MLSEERYETILFLIILSPDLSLATTKVEVIRFNYDITHDITSRNKS